MEKIKRFIQEKTKRTISDDENLIEEGIVDSFTMMELISFLEEEYKITIDMEKINPKNFNSVRTIAAFVERE